MVSNFSVNKTMHTQQPLLEYAAQMQGRLAVGAHGTNRNPRTSLNTTAAEKIERTSSMATAAEKLPEMIAVHMHQYNRSF